MIRFLLPFAFLLSFLPASAQKYADPNLDMESVKLRQKLPDYWFEWGSGYQLSADSTVKFSGKRSVSIKAPAQPGNSVFGSAATSIPAIYEGSQIELKGYMKFENVEGWVGMLMRIDGNSDMLQFDNMQNRKMQGTQDWKEYSIKLPYPKNATKINVGGILAGKGALWIDHFEILIDGKPLAEAPLRKPAAATLDKEFEKGSNFVVKNLQAKQIEELGSLGELWGFLKYYHPAVTGGNHNWDYELFRILPKVTANISTAERQGLIYQWIAKLGPVKVGQEKAPQGEVALKPEFEWIKKGNFGSKTEALLDSIRRAPRETVGYYAALQDGAKNPAFMNEDEYKEMSYQDTGVKLLSLFRYWNMIEYFFPYKNLIKEDWHAVLREFVPKFVNTADEAAYKLATLELITRVMDTHANIYNPGPALDGVFGDRYAAGEIAFVEGKPVVTGYYNVTLGKESGLEIGDVIEEVNGKKVADLVKSKLPYTPGSNMPVRLKNMAPNLLRSSDSLVTVRLRREGKTMNVKVPLYKNTRVNLYANYNKKDTCFKMLQPDVAYVFPGKYKNSYLPQILPEIAKTKGLIIDMRCYPSEFMVFSFAPFLLPEATGFAKFTNGNIQTPGLFTFTPPLKTGKTNPDYYKGKVVLIVNETTLSQAEYTSMAFAASPNVTILGSTTAAADGNVSLIMLPGQIRTGISGIGIYYPDGRGTQQVGIVPNVEVKQTIAGVKAGRDELLEKALELVKAK